MSVALTLIGKTPSVAQFVLGTFTERYKCDATADLVIIDPDVPRVGDAHPDYPHMYITNRYCSESGESASALDLIYTGCFFDDGEGGPFLPAQKPTSGGQVASATTNTTSVIWPLITTNPITATFYSITRTLNFISNDPDDASQPEDPPEITDLITYDLGFGATVPGSSSPEIVELILTEAFLQYITESPPIVEPIVVDQFYQITKTKTRTLLPWGPPP